MADNLFNELQEFNQSQEPRTYSGLLGLPVASKTVNVPGRNGYVYVRLRDNTSEIIQAYNDKVSPVYNLPVLVTRQNNRWVIASRDIDRYENWGSDSAFLPAHAAQHEFNRDDIGGDVVFSYADQFMPLNVYPSGTPGSPNVLVAGYAFKKSDNTWAYVGNTGTPSLLIYRPTDNQARMVLVYLDRDTGNPGILINSGTSFAANLTGTHDVLQYLPTNAADQEPLKAVRLVSGTQRIEWDNLYDIRQFYGGGASGTGGGGGTPGGSDTQVQYNDGGAFGGSSRFVFDDVNGVVVVGDGSAVPAAGSNAFHLVADGASPGLLLWAGAGTNFSIAPFMGGVKSRGTTESPAAVEADDYLFRVRARGHDGTDWVATRAEILFDVPYNWSAGNHPTRIGMWLTPSGSAVMEEVLHITTAGPDIRNATKYLIGGNPHNHRGDTDEFGSVMTYVTGTAYNLDAGRRYVENTLLEWSSISRTGLTLTSGSFYYSYLYNNSGVAALEESTTVPVWSSTYRYWQKTGDASRRMVGGFRAINTNTITKFVCVIHDNTVEHYYMPTPSAVFTLVNNLTSTAAWTSFSLSSYIPANAATHWFANIIPLFTSDGDDGAVGVSPIDQDTDTGLNGLISVRTAAARAGTAMYPGRVWVPIHTSLTAYYRTHVVAGACAAIIRVYGFKFTI